MEKTLICSRKFDGEKYDFFLNSPSYTGEIGVLGIELNNYISVTTPKNCFGYDDTILLNIDRVHGVYTAYTLHRYLPKWILQKIQKKMIELNNKYC